MKIRGGIAAWNKGGNWGFRSDIIFQMLVTGRGRPTVVCR